MAMRLAEAFIFLGKLAIVGGNCYFCMIIWPHVVDQRTPDPDAPADQPAEEVGLLAPLICVALGTYVTAEVTLGMFDESVLALMTCRAVDIDMSGGEENCQWGPPTFYDGKMKDLGSAVDKHTADQEAKRNAKDGYKKATSIQ